MHLNMMPKDYIYIYILTVAASVHLLTFGINLMFNMVTFKAVHKFTSFDIGSFINK